MAWTEEQIRNELKRLDKITGLKGAELPIHFGNAISYLAMFCAGEKMYFLFSNYYFNNPKFSDESALNTIRHEYAHYLAYVQYGDCSHGARWKACCQKVGARASRLYSERLNTITLDSEKGKKALQVKLSEYEPGQTILHPIYDEGTILSVNDDSSIATVGFAKGMTKHLSLSWIEDNCIVI